jgi:DNA-binding NarL/FixJ family response regulator
MADKRILVVNSKGLSARSLVEELERAGFEARGATYAGGAMEAYQAQPCDLVLMEVMGQGAEAMEFLRMLTRYDPEALVVVMATEATVDLAVDALQSGARQFIKDPLDVPELVVRLRELLSQRSDKAVRGNLRDLALTSIISVNCNEHNQAELVIRRQGRVGLIYFDDGTIVHASLDSEEGEAVIYEMLSWGDGSFSLRQDVPPPKRTVETDWTGLLLEGMRRIDHGAAGWGLEEEEGAASDDPGRFDVAKALMAVERWEPGKEDEAVSDERGMSTLLEALRAIDGIEGVVVCSPGGEPLFEAETPDAARKAVLTALVGQRSRTLAFVLNVGQPRRVFLGGAGWRLVVVPHGDDYVGAWISQRASPEYTADEVRTVLYRYRQTRGGRQ